MKIDITILVVDDNKELCNGLKEYLENEGYVVTCANSGKDATALLLDNKYDIALVDIKLPDIQGTDLVKKLAKISPSTDFIHIYPFQNGFRYLHQLFESFQLTKMIGQPCIF